MILTPEGFEPPAFGFGIRRAAIAPWRRALCTGRAKVLGDREDNTFQSKSMVSLTPEGVEPPAFGFGIRRAAIAPWRLGRLAVPRTQKPA